MKTDRLKRGIELRREGFWGYGVRQKYYRVSTLPFASIAHSFLFDWCDEVALIESVLVFAEKVRLYLTNRP